MPADHPATQLAFGAVVENLAQAASAIGLPRASPLAGPHEPGPIVRMTVAPDHRVPPEARAHPLFQRHTNRFPFHPTPVPGAVIEQLVGQSEPPARSRVLVERSEIEAMSRLVQQASEARFQTEEIHELLSGSLRFTPQEVRRGDGLDVATLHLPPGGRQMLSFLRSWKRMDLANRLGAFKAFAKIEGASIAEASALLALLAPAGAPAAMAAGRLLERVWIELNRKGFAVHPYFVVTDQLHRLRQGTVPTRLVLLVERTKRGLHELLGTDQVELLMLLRIGSPRTEPPRSVRRSLAATFSASPIE